MSMIWVSSSMHGTIWLHGTHWASRSSRAATQPTPPLCSADAASGETVALGPSRSGHHQIVVVLHRRWAARLLRTPGAGRIVSALVRTIDRCDPDGIVAPTQKNKCLRRPVRGSHPGPHEPVRRHQAQQCHLGVDSNEHVGYAILGISGTSLGTATSAIQRPYADLLGSAFDGYVIRFLKTFENQWHLQNPRAATRTTSSGHIPWDLTSRCTDYSACDVRTARRVAGRVLAAGFRRLTLGPRGARNDRSSHGHRRAPPPQAVQVDRLVAKGCRRVRSTSTRTTSRTQPRNVDDDLSDSRRRRNDATSNSGTTHRDRHEPDGGHIAFFVARRDHDGRVARRDCAGDVARATTAYRQRKSPRQPEQCFETILGSSPFEPISSANVVPF